MYEFVNYMFIIRVARIRVCESVGVNFPRWQSKTSRKRGLINVRMFAGTRILEGREHLESVYARIFSGIEHNWLAWETHGNSLSLAFSSLVRNTKLWNERISVGRNTSGDIGGATVRARPSLRAPLCGGDPASASVCTSDTHVHKGLPRPVPLPVLRPSSLSRLWLIRTRRQCHTMG